MTCSEIRLDLEAYARGVLDPTATERVRLHLSECAACAGAAVAGSPAAAPPGGIAAGGVPPWLGWSGSAALAPAAAVKVATSTEASTPRRQWVT